MGRESRTPAVVVLTTLVLLAITGLGYVAEHGARFRFSPEPAAAHPVRAKPPAPFATRPGVVLDVKPALRRVAGPGDRGDSVRDLQVRLRQLAWYAGTITGVYDHRTRTGVADFQRKRGLPGSGIVDRRTRTRLRSMTVTPSVAEKHNKVANSASTSAPLDARCRTGRALCVDKVTRTLRWVVDGKVLATVAVRFGAAYTPTREGLFHVIRKSADHVSTIFHTAMPYAMFFSGGQAVHYSSDFAARGYAGASHGCVNVRDYTGVRWLFSQVAVGDKVVVYFS